MADLLLDEPLRVIELHQVGDVRVPQRMQIQRGVDVREVPGGAERFIRGPSTHPSPALGQPQSRR